jgi:ABC-type iron transport system FetAB ATPase subunit
VLEASDVALRRAGRRVLAGAALAAPAASVTALLGPSGAGKSSMLRCLVRLETAEHGRVLLRGEDVTGLDPRVLRRRVGLVAQAPVMLPGSVRDNLCYALEPARDDAALAGALTDAGLEPAFLDREARRLSGGETARVAIARALVREPEALLLDEPTAALDPASASALEALLGRLAEGGLAIVLATHDRDLAGRLAARATLVAGGTTPAHGTVDEVVAAWP